MATTLNKEDLVAGPNGGDQPDRINVKAELDMKLGLATFTEDNVNGVVMLDPKVIKVPIQSIIIMAAQAICAANGLSVSSAKVTRDGVTATRETGPTIIRPGDKIQ